MAEKASDAFKKKEGVPQKSATRIYLVELFCIKAFQKSTIRILKQEIVLIFSNYIRARLVSRFFDFVSPMI